MSWAQNTFRWYHIGSKMSANGNKGEHSSQTWLIPHRSDYKANVKNMLFLGRIRIPFFQRGFWLVFYDYTEFDIHFTTGIGEALDAILSPLNVESGQSFIWDDTAMNIEALIPGRMSSFRCEWVVTDESASVGMCFVCRSAFVWQWLHF